MFRVALRIVLATAVALSASPVTSGPADLQRGTNLEVDTAVIDGFIESLAFLRDGKSLIVTGSKNLWVFQTFPTFETSSIALHSLNIRATSSFVDRRGYLYVVGASPKLTREGRLLVFDPANMAIVYDITIERPFSYPSVYISESGRVVMSNLASGSVSVFKDSDFQGNESTDQSGSRITKYSPVTFGRLLGPVPEVIGLFCGPSLRASWLEGVEGQEGAVISSPFGGGTLEIARRGDRRNQCDPPLDIRRSLEEGSGVTTLSHTVVRSGELVFAGSNETDELFVRRVVSSAGTGLRLSGWGSTETGLRLSGSKTDKPNVKGDVHIVADDAVEVVVVASPRVPQISVFRYAEGTIERVGTSSIDHTVGAAAISHDGAIVAMSSSKAGWGVITLLRNPLNLREVKVDYRTLFTNRWAQRALKAQGYDPRGIDGIIGRRTIAAIERFQADKKLEVNGRLNAETLKMLSDLADAKSE